MYLQRERVITKASPVAISQCRKPTGGSHDARRTRISFERHQIPADFDGGWRFRVLTDRDAMHGRDVCCAEEEVIVLPPRW